jgi:glutamyl-tRNA synthetase
MVRTRFAPSPTGFLHVGGARTALFAWAYARKHGGQFVLRIEDTDLERSTQQSIDAILDGMRWLKLGWDEGPFFQMQRLDRYQAVIAQLQLDGHAYPCYATREELDAMRETQRAQGLKPRYDGRWRPENVKVSGIKPPTGAKPVIRFRNPDHGDVAWDDLVKGRISISNDELDDLVLMRADGVPTYNFGVVVDDLDMKITHVIRGDDHVNNTPRQINIYRALRSELPQFAHMPMILGPDGERLSKRHGAVSVMQYRDDGYLPEALVNYLARLGWSHGDAEIFSAEQLVEWFDLAHISRSPAQFDPDKLKWLNQHYLKLHGDDQLAAWVKPLVERDGGKPDDGPDLVRVVALLKDRAATLPELADAAMLFYREPAPREGLLMQHLTPAAETVLRNLKQTLATIDWNRAAIGTEIKRAAAGGGLKMPQIAMPLRVLVTGQAQTPSVDAVLELIGRERVLERIGRFVQ